MVRELQLEQDPAECVLDQVTEDATGRAAEEETIAAVLDCTTPGELQSATVVLFNTSRSTQGRLVQAEIGETVDVPELLDCVALALTQAEPRDIEDAWEGATSISELGRRVVTATSDDCVAGAISSDTELEGATVLDRVLDASSEASATRDPVSVDVDGGLTIDLVETPVTIAVVSETANDRLVSLEFVIERPGTPSELGALTEAIELLDLDASAPTLIEADDLDVTTGDFRICTDSTDDGQSIRVLPAAVGCDR